MAFYPYLNFGGNCREALTRYHEIFGGELEVMGMADLPDGEEVPEGMEGMVMHAALVFDDGQMLLASDDPSGTFKAPQGMYVNYTTADIDAAKRVFEALADGGEVTMAPGETFWSPFFGICADRFGTPWMVNGEPPDAG
jgi:PhnB protein